jgi:hypothetical protein
MSDERKPPVWPWIVALLMKPAGERFWGWAVFLAAVDILLIAIVALYPTIRDEESGPATFLSVVAILALSATYVLRPWAR